MKVFKLCANADDYNFFELVNKNDWNFEDFNGTSIIKSWKPFKIKRSRGKDIPLEIFLQLHLLHYMLNSKSKDIFECIFKDKVELLPVEYDEPYYMINVINMLDALDMDKSEYKRLSSGRIFLCSKYVFKEEVIGNNAIFKYLNFQL